MSFKEILKKAAYNATFVAPLRVSMRKGVRFASLCDKEVSLFSS
jgi:hypothetical protein